MVHSCVVDKCAISIAHIAKRAMVAPPEKSLFGTLPLTFLLNRFPMLNSIIVLDLTRHLPGPYATMVLADLGAEVIKIEDPRWGDVVRWTPPTVDGESALFLQINRNKKSLTLNLKSPEAREVFLKLARKADVLIESFRPGVTARLEIDYGRIKPENPRLVYCSISGYGQEGPYQNRAGHDINYVALAGLLGLTTDHEGTPVLPAVQIADLAAGAMFSLVGILAALWEREKTGRGRYIDLSMMDGTLALLPVAFSRIVTRMPTRVGEKMELTGSVPFYNVYRTADGKFLALGALEPKFWENFCEAIEKPELASRQFVIGHEQERVFEEVRQTLASRTQSEWIRTFEGRDVCCEPVAALDEVIFNPQIRHRGMVREVKHSSLGPLKLLGNPIHSPDSEETPDRPAPKLGEHTNEILKSLGYSESEILNFKSTGVI